MKERRVCVCVCVCVCVFLCLSLCYSCYFACRVCRDRRPGTLAELCRHTILRKTPRCRRLLVIFAGSYGLRDDCAKNETTLLCLCHENGNERKNKKNIDLSISRSYKSAHSTGFEFSLSARCFLVCALVKETVN